MCTFIFPSNEYKIKFESEMISLLFRLPKFVVRLCLDVLLEILRSGNRCQLAELECIGRRFNQMIENFLGKTPFLRFDLKKWRFLLLEFLEYFSKFF